VSLRIASWLRASADMRWAIASNASAGELAERRLCVTIDCTIASMFLIAMVHLGQKQTLQPLRNVTRGDVEPGLLQ
jgi:hypothetical protein